MMNFDTIVVGAGQAGPFLAAKLVNRGRKVALVEARDLGGTCVNRGCTPTKTLRKSARVAGLDWPALVAMDEAALAAALFAPTSTNWV